MEDMWLFFIGLGKLPTNFQRQFRKNLIYVCEIYARNNSLLLIHSIILSLIHKV